MPPAARGALAPLLLTLAVAPVAAGPAPPAPASAPANPPPADPAVAATVNGEGVRLDEVDAVIRRRRAALGPLTDAQVRELRLAVTEDLIDDLLIRQFLRQHGPKVEPAELDRHFQALTAALQRQGRTLPDFLRQTGQTEAQAKETWAALLKFDKYVEGRATDAEVRRFYEAHKAAFDGSLVRAGHIVVRVSPGAPPGERVAAREKLAAVRADITSGKTTFSDAARKHSMCPTARAGGDLGYVGLRDAAVDEAVARAAFALKPGEVSDPTDTDYGVHLVTATERKPGSAGSFEQVSELVRDAYADDVRRQIVAHTRKQSRITVTVP